MPPHLDLLGTLYILLDKTVFEILQTLILLSTSLALKGLKGLSVFNNHLLQGHY